MIRPTSSYQRLNSKKNQPPPMSLPATTTIKELLKLCSSTTVLHSLHYSRLSVKLHNLLLVVFVQLCVLFTFCIYCKSIYLLAFQVLKHSIVVQMLMGEIPEKSVFRQKGTQQKLKPYFELVHSVRSGELSTYQQTVAKHEALFKKDKTLNLILRFVPVFAPCPTYSFLLNFALYRMRNNVIKTGLRKINLSYSRISLQDICTKLKLDSVDDAEFIVAKVRDPAVGLVFLFLAYIWFRLLETALLMLLSTTRKSICNLRR